MKNNFMGVKLWLQVSPSRNQYLWCCLWGKTRHEMEYCWICFLKKYLETPTLHFASFRRCTWLKWQQSKKATTIKTRCKCAYWKREQIEVGAWRVGMTRKGMINGAARDMSQEKAAEIILETSSVSRLCQKGSGWAKSS